MRSGNLCRIEVHHFPFQDFLHLVHLGIVAHLYEPIVDLAEIDLVCDLIGRLPAETALLVLSSQKFLAVGRGVGHVEDVSEHRGAWHLHPV